MANATIEKFGWPATLVHDYRHWVLLLRPAQPTLGSLVLAAKSDATAFGELPAEAHAELKTVTAEIEALLKRAVDYRKLNYLMLMMVDPHVHFHVIPRHEGERERDGLSITDAGWPGPPALGQAVALSDEQIAALVGWLKGLMADGRSGAALADGSPAQEQIRNGAPNPVRDAGPEAIRDEDGKSWDVVDESSDESFPASDPPNYSRPEKD
ncbi:HIT family protein [Sphingomonas histidinilytica]|jgi:diadenosine tetraphosphate (Ap4A) HIT family hydrolase|uniref:Diadenosine tetraphosphate (Ap4A) hydrolase n=1 Tax=Rhizorhabdus histidinilytica TaxID=439228 RepID=A0A1T5C0J4_9SPHN|nr:HIT family protein [Rhizorhabdus histidinilytica]QEH77357.1 HIT family protein [Sphingomonas sp. C8-2]SKB52921.1 Diadenosine tetraphosphate (Ap4A) hydrolase [Rhizorhabdus histidinilytica]